MKKHKFVDNTIHDDVTQKMDQIKALAEDLNKFAQMGMLGDVEWKMEEILQATYKAKWSYVSACIAQEKGRKTVL